MRVISVVDDDASVLSATVDLLDSVGLAWVTFLTPHWGLKVGGDYSKSDHTENSVSASVYARW